MVGKHNLISGRLSIFLALVILLTVVMMSCGGTQAPLTLTISKPVDGANMTAADLEVRGTVSDPKAVVMINDVKAAMAPGGIFGYNMTLTEGQNIIKVVATRGKETVTKTVTVTYTKPIRR